MIFARHEKNLSPTPPHKGEGLNLASPSFFTVGRVGAACFFSPPGRRWPERPDEGARVNGYGELAPSSRCRDLLPLGEKKPRRTLSVQRHIRSIALFLTLLFASLPAFAFNPDEVLSDPALEARARALTVQLRCMVCQNQSIDDSNAELARDLRVLVRERLTQGDSDEAVMNYVVSRYGEFVLLKPRLSARTIALWGAPIALILIGATSVFVFARRRVAVADGQKLTSDEEERIRELLEK